MLQGKSFLVGTCVTSAKEFEEFAVLAARLKRLGNVSMGVSQLSGRTTEDIPEGGSPWHDYTSCLPVLAKKFFPHPTEAPFLNMAYVRKNVALLRACVKVLRKYKLGATFSTHDPFFMPEAFFVKYPHLRGARLDHPRRTREEAFGICRDCPEGREMFAFSMAKLMKEVPELTDLNWLTNDAGAGICWNEYLYPGPNGPDHCRQLNTGQRVANILDALDKGAGRKKIDVTVQHANFTWAERQLIPHYVDNDRLFWSRADDRLVNVGPVMDNPVLGMIDPVAIVAALEKAMGPDVKKIRLAFGTNYSRYHELLETTEIVISMIEDFSKTPAAGTIGRLTFLRKLCKKWVGEKQADDLLETLIDVNKAFAYKQVALVKSPGNYVGVSMRFITRPLVAMPEKLTDDEEAYFLPHVFNPSVNEGRMDYLDWHGGRLQFGSADMDSVDPRPREVAIVCRQFNRAADQLARLQGKGAAFFRGMAISLRMYSSIIRSIGNFYGMQIVRDRNADRFEAGPQIPSKVFSMTGDEDLLLIHEYMRDELDNTAELLDLLENGGMRRFITACRPGDVEDTFMLGADVKDQLRKKMAIMRRHWLDASAYLAPPHK